MHSACIKRIIRKLENHLFTHISQNGLALEYWKESKLQTAAKCLI